MTTRRLLRIEQVREKIGGWTPKTLYSKIRQGLFPPPVHTGDNTSTWPEDEIDRWIADRIHERNARLRDGKK